MIATMHRKKSGRSIAFLVLVALACFGVSYTAAEPRTAEPLTFEFVQDIVKAQKDQKSKEFAKIATDGITRLRESAVELKKFLGDPEVKEKYQQHIAILGNLEKEFQGVTSEAIGLIAHENKAAIGLITRFKRMNRKIKKKDWEGFFKEVTQVLTSLAATKQRVLAVKEKHVDVRHKVANIKVSVEEDSRALTIAVKEANDEQSKAGTGALFGAALTVFNVWVVANSNGGNPWLEAWNSYALISTGIDTAKNIQQYMKESGKGQSKFAIRVAQTIQPERCWFGTSLYKLRRFIPDIDIPWDGAALICQ